MLRVNSNRTGINSAARRQLGARKWAVVAAGAIAISGSAFGQVQLFFDNNGATAGFGNGTAATPAGWKASATIWNTVGTAGTTHAPGVWLQPGQTAGSSDFNIANFDPGATNVVNLSDTEDVGGINFNTAFATTIEGAGTLNFGSGNYTITDNVTQGQSIEVPVTGSGTLTYVYTNTGNNGNVTNFTGNMTGFTGTLIIAPDTNAAASVSNYTQLALNSDLGIGASIQLDNFALLTASNPLTNGITLVASQLAFTNHAPITLNATNVANSQELISAGNGTANNGVVSTTSGIPAGFVAGIQTIATYAGVISGNSSNLNFGFGTSGGRGTIVLDNQETYTGTTCDILANNNGLLQLGVDNALPSTTILYFGPNPATAATGSSAVAPFDLNGHNVTVAGFGTSPKNTNTTVYGVGNIYDTGSISGSATPVTITVNGSAATTYAGDIGDSDLNTNPFNNMAPYVTTTGGFQIQANKNISLSISGTTNMTLAPVAALANGDEYTGTTTVNSGSTLALGRSSTYGGTGTFAGSNFTLTGGGAVTIHGGATLSSLPTNFASTNPTYMGGASGNIELQSGASFTPGGTNTTGIFSTQSMTFDSGASMTFDIANGSTFDQMFVYNNLTLDSSGPNHTVNINVPSGDTLSPGIYTLIYTAGGIGTDGVNNFVLGTPTIGSDKLSLIDTGSNLEVQVLAPALQWDPSGQGPTSGNNTINEGGGEWTDGTGSDNAPASLFYNFANATETTWSNSNTSQVIIGNDATQNGGQIFLGSNVVVNNVLTFGQIAQGANYSIVNVNGNTYTLTLGGGLSVSNSASASGSPSAEIDVPVILAGSQAWNVDPGQKLVVTGAVTENDATPSYTLTKTGTGELDLNGTTGSIGMLNVAAGSVVLGTMNSIGNASVTLNGGALEFASTGTFANIFNASGASGFGLGVNSGATATVTNGITSTGPMALVDNGTLILNGNISATSLTNETLGTTTFNGTAAFTGAITNTTTGGRIYFNGNTTASGMTITAGTTLLASTATDSFTNGINITAGTLVVGSASDVGVTATNLTGNAINFTPATSNAGTLNLGGVTSLPNNISTGPSSATQFGSTITTWPFSGPAVSVPITLSGNISGGGNLTLMGTDYTLSGTNTFGPPSGPGGAGGGLTLGNTGSNASIPMIVHADSATAFGTAGITVNVAGVTLDIQTNVNANAIKGNATVTKTGTGTLNFTGMTATGPSGNQLGYVIQNGAIEISNINGLGGNSAATIANASSPSQGKLTIDPTASLLVNTNGNDYTGTVTMAGGSIVRLQNVSNAGDYNLTTYYADSGGNVDTHNAVMNVTASSLIDNQDQATTSTTRNLAIQMPITVSSGATLTLQSDNSAGNYEQAATVLRGEANNSNYQNNLTLSSGATLVASGTGDVDLGDVATGEPIIGQGTPGSEALMQLGSHTFLNDTGAATQNQGTNDMTRLIVNGSGSAGLRIEAPMNAAYTVPNNGGAPSLRTYDGTTGLTGINTTGTASAGTTPTGYATIGNAFTVLSPNRAAALSNTYTLTDGTTITPSGTLTLAATDAAGATGVINAGPAVSSNVALALDNAAGSGGTLTYKIDPGGNGATFANFAGLTLQRTNATAAGVTAQLLGTTKVPALSITGGAKMDIAKQALVIDASGAPQLSQIAGYLGSAYDHGNWDGPGIGSSATSLTAGTTIGYALNSALSVPFTIFDGQSVDSSAILVKYTWFGDLNLDGIVNSSDLTAMAPAGTTNATWTQGDFNYDGVVNADDFALFMLGDAKQTGQLTSAVPEPAVGAMLALAVAGLSARKRRR
jgi:fibronectin-binding autotransporter adhesin